MALDSELHEPPHVGVGNKGERQEDDGVESPSNGSNDEDCDTNLQPSDDDLEDGELEDDGQEDIVESILPVAETVSEEIKDIPTVSVSSTIPSLLDLKISPPRNGMMSSGRKASRWARKSFGRKRYSSRDYGDSADEDAEEMLPSKRSRKRKQDGKSNKQMARYVDHDQNEDENGTEYSENVWFSSSRASRKKFGRVKQQPLVDSSDSPPGPYDSPYASPPGPYDSPSASEDEEANGAWLSKPVAKRARAVYDSDRLQKPDRESALLEREKTSDIQDQCEKQQVNSGSSPVRDSENNMQEPESVTSLKNSASSDVRYQEQDHRAKTSNVGLLGSAPSAPVSRSRSPEPLPNKKRRLADTPYDERPICRFYIEGKCSKGGDCHFKHVQGAELLKYTKPKKQEICRYYNKTGHCLKGSECLYYHETWPCMAFHIQDGGGCPFDDDDCKFSHEELTDETRPLFEKALAEEEQQPIEEAEPKKKALLGDFPSDKKIPSLFDLNIPRRSMTAGAHGWQMGMRGFPMKAATMNRFAPMGPRMLQFPPRHITMQLIRMQMAALSRHHRGGGGRGQFPFLPMYGDPMKMSFDPSLFADFSQSDEFAEDEDFDWNEQDGEEEDAEWYDSSAEPSEPVAEPHSNESSAPVTSAPATSSSFSQSLNTGADSAPSSAVQTPEAPVRTVSTDASVLPTSCPGVVAGVDLTQLPPVQRELFLRLHRQQQNNVVSESVAPPPVAAPVAVVLAAAESIEKKQQPGPLASMPVTSSGGNLSVSDILKVLVQQPPPTTTTPSTQQMSLAPMFNINQVLSAINHVPGGSLSRPCEALKSGTDQSLRQKPTDLELEMYGLRTSVVYHLRPYECATGIVVPSYMDLNDSAWDEDPRVQHWRRDVELGRMPRREERRKPATPAVSVVKTVDVPVKRDPRRRNDVVVTVSSESPMQQQQLHIQQMVQQMINNNQPLPQHQQQLPQLRPPLTNYAPPMMRPMAVPPMMPGSLPGVRVPPPVTGVLPVVPDIRARPPGFPTVLPPGMPPMGMPLPPSTTPLFPPLLTFNPSVPPPFMASLSPMNGLPPTSTVVPSMTSMSLSCGAATQSVSKSSSVEKLSSLPVSTNSLVLENASVTNLPPLEGVDSSTMPPPKATIDLRNDARFRKRKSNSSSLGVVKQVAATSDSAKISENLSDPIVATDANTSNEKDVLLFQSPLAASSIQRSQSSAVSGYNRPPNKRYVELAEQSGLHSRRPKNVLDVVLPKNIGFLANGPADVSVVSTVGSAVHHFPSTSLSAAAELSMCESAPEGSLKDMFKTIDPTASPFC